jgi:Domain of unknown function (DUF1844)
MPDSPGEQPKIIIDSDWKAQAQKEREKLAQKEQEAAAKKAPPGPRSAAGAPAAGPADPQGDPEGMPPADFQALVGTMVTQCLMYMGGFPDPQTGRALVSLEHARFHIDLLAVLEEKTRGNITKEESEDLAAAVNELRLRFVEIAKAIAQASKEGRLSRGGQPGMGGPAGAGGPSLSFNPGGFGGGPGSGMSGPGF